MYGVWSSHSTPSFVITHKMFTLLRIHTQTHDRIHKHLFRDFLLPLPSSLFSLSSSLASLFSMAFATHSVLLFSVCIVSVNVDNECTLAETHIICGFTIFKPKITAHTQPHKYPTYSMCLHCVIITYACVARPHCVDLMEDFRMHFNHTKSKHFGQHIFFTWETAVGTVNENQPNTHRDELRVYANRRNGLCKWKRISFSQIYVQIPQLKYLSAVKYTKQMVFGVQLMFDDSLSG